jgi:hypothetical protein
MLRIALVWSRAFVIFFQLPGTSLETEKGLHIPICSLSFFSVQSIHFTLHPGYLFNIPLDPPSLLRYFILICPNPACITFVYLREHSGFLSLLHPGCQQSAVIRLTPLRLLHIVISSV